MEETHHQITHRKNISMQEENKLMYVLKRIWPTVYRIINSVLYFILSLIKAIVRGIIDQIRNF